jgi:hypothetical protein
MHDNALDPRVDDASPDWTEIADVAASIIGATIQARVREANDEKLRRAS